MAETLRTPETLRSDEETLWDLTVVYRAGVMRLEMEHSSGQEFGVDAVHDALAEAEHWLETTGYDDHRLIGVRLKRRGEWPLSPG